MAKEEAIRQFVSLLDEMISELERILKEDQQSGETTGIPTTERYLNKFLRTRQAALDGTLHPSGGSGMGASRAMSEFNYDELVELANKIDDFYMTQLATL